MTTVILDARMTIDNKALVKALGAHPDAIKLIADGMEHVIAEAQNVLKRVGHPEAREVAGKVGAKGQRGPVAPFQARIVPGIIPVGLVTSDHPASRRFEYGYEGSRKAIFKGRGPNAVGRAGSRGGRWRAKVMIPTPPTGFMRTALVRAGRRKGRKVVFGHA